MSDPDRPAPEICRRPAGYRHAMQLVCLAIAMAGCPGDGPSAVDAGAQADALSLLDDRALAAAANPGDWPTHGRNYAEQRYSPLSDIDESTAPNLGLAWTVDLGTRRGLEATPLVVDGRMFVSTTWSVVEAFDAKTGQRLWRFDPEVPKARARMICCDVVNRGVALYRGKVYVGTLDGRLIAIDAASGQEIWSAQTFDPADAYAITGAPRVVEGKVIIGNGGAELGVRGYFSAYDAETGDLVWRFYTVPGDPGKPQGHPALDVALPTWKGSVPGSEWWKVGGGGTVWDSLAYDPELGLLYVGVGNGSPWARAARDPGGGDNLYLSSILAVRPADASLVWHYQTTPGDNWDFTATQHMILADLEIDGRIRQVLMQAPKNGFFYVLDRATGELLSAEKFAKVTWASHVDLETGRPIETGAGDYIDGPAFVYPGSMGAHNWHPMAFHPGTGFVYIPAQEVPGQYVPLSTPFVYEPRSYKNAGVDFSRATEFPREIASGSLVAWDPVVGKAAWTVPHPTPGNGGVLATGGGLVFQGTAGGRFVAYSAATGKELWSVQADTGIIAAPISYAVDGQQYVSVLAGWGGAFGLAGGDAAEAVGSRAGGRLLAFKLGGALPMPVAPPAPAPAPPLPAMEADEETLAIGSELYALNCATCHGVGGITGGVLPDLRRLSPELRDALAEIVLGGAYQDRGMPSFEALLSEQDLHTILLYLSAQAGAIRTSGE